MNNMWLVNDKLMPIELPEVCLPRPDLLRTFDEAAKKPMVIVTAAAGCGKSFSTVLWLKKSKRTYAWISLDAYDNSLTVFYRLFCAAMLSLQPANIAMQEIYRSATFASSPVEHTVRLLAEFQPDSQLNTLVFDDIHTITSAEIRKSWPLILKRLPNPFTVLVLSRNTISEKALEDFNIADVSYITAETLAFSEKEMQSYLKAYGHDFSAEQITNIHNITGGWAMGIHAIAQNSQIELDSTHEFLLDDYMHMQIWNTWEDDLKDFLMKISITNEVNVEICTVLTGPSDSDKLLSSISRTCAFISHVFGSVYRFHNLFLDFLRRQAEKENLHTPELHKTVALFYSEKENFALACTHAMKSGDIWTIIQTTQRFQNHVANFFDEYVDFYTTFNRNVLSEAACEAYPFLYSSLISEHYLLGNATQMCAYLDKLYQKFPIISEQFPQFIENSLGFFHLDPRFTFEEQMDRFKDYWELVSENNIPSQTNHCSLTLQLPLLHRSNRDHYEFTEERVFTKLKSTLGNMFKDSYDFLTAYIRAGLLMEQGRFQAAEEQVAPYTLFLINNEEALGQYPAEIIFSILSFHAIFAHTMNNYDEAAEWLARIKSYIIKFDAEPLQHNFLAMQTTLELYRGSIQAAEKWCSQYFVTDSGDVVMFKIYQHFTTVRAYIALGRLEEAYAFGNKLLKLSLDFDRLIDAAETNVLLAIIAWAMNKKTEAVDTLEQALTTLKPYEFIRVVAAEGNAVLPILKRLTKRVDNEQYQGSLSLPYLNMIMIAAHGYAKYRKGLFCYLPTKAIKFTDKQKRVLELFSQGYSRKEVAEFLEVTPDTIKAHATVIYRKLNVHNVVDAVLRAQELGLL